jgi:hypothetical protein
VQALKLEQKSAQSESDYKFLEAVWGNLKNRVW